MKEGEKMPSVILNSEYTGDGTGKVRAQCDVCRTVSSFYTTCCRDTAGVAVPKGWNRLPGDKYICPTCTLQDKDRMFEFMLRAHVAPQFTPLPNGGGFRCVGYR